MTSDEPRFYLHMGVGRTGSSALQIAFVRNQGALAAAETVYPTSHGNIEAAHSDQAMSGNAGVIRRLLMDDSTDQEDAFKALQRRIGDVGSHHVLFSSELLFRARRKNVARLVKLLDRMDRPLFPILYVRNVAGHALSSYGQRITRSGAQNSLWKYCTENYRPKYRSALEKLLGIVAESSISVVHYDSERENLFDHFLYEILGAPSTTRVDDPVTRRVNRSLTSGELAILRRVNAAVRTKNESRRLSQSLLSEFPQVHAEKSIPHGVVSVLRDRFGDEVDWVNRHFFDDSRLTVTSSELAVSDDEDDLKDLDPMRRVLVGLVALTGARVKE